LGRRGGNAASCSEPIRKVKNFPPKKRGRKTKRGVAHQEEAKELMSRGEELEHSVHTFEKDGGGEGEPVRERRATILGKTRECKKKKKKKVHGGGGKGEIPGNARGSWMGWERVGGGRGNSAKKKRTKHIVYPLDLCGQSQARITTKTDEEEDAAPSRRKLQF